ncbi:MAG: hypothetical protein JWN83_1686, partial [Chitinophagaceae bacterium]|nr:hypothetical protein [Chitinophagaceae bacterium]
MKFILTFFIASLSIFISVNTIAQDNTDNSKTKTIAAGPEYKRSSFYQWLWGKNYRKEWTTPVTFPIAKLDTLRGGIVKYKVGGGHQSKSLHLKNKQDKEYALRTVNKSLKVLIPPIFYNTFIEHIANDEISMSHPYGALGVPVMAQAAGIPHSDPQFIWVPKQPALDTLNTVYGDRVYLFEQRPSGDWSDNANFLNFPKFIGSDELLNKMYDDNDNHVDQVAFIKARLFDMVIGDWDRHLDQWKWGKIEKGEQNIYVPIPTDRDQAFSTTGGVLLKAAISASGQKYLQTFDYTIQDVTAIERRFLDRLFANQITLEEWQTQARGLQHALTDNVIENSVKQMPAEIFAISGNEIIAKLKSRRNHLAEYATQYYNFLAKEVEIVGSKKNELFEINHLNSNETSVNLYKINKEGEIKNKPFYSRVFKTGETKEIRLYGLSGNDIYRINGKVNTGIKIRIIGGDEKDSVINNSNIKIHVYDDAKNSFIGSSIKLHLSDSTDHTFDYDAYRPDKKGIGPLLGYTNEDPFFVGLGYNATHHKWRKFPYASKQSIGVKYSISQKAFGVFYKGIFPELIGKWDLLLNADYDAIRWLNFYGVGNNTTSIIKDIPFNRTQSKQILGNIGFQRNFGKSTINVSGFFQSVKIRNDFDRFLAKNIAPTQPGIFKTNNYVGAGLMYKLVLLNDSIVPTSGFFFLANASYFQNLTQSESFQRYTGIAQVYIPLIPKFSLAIRGAGGTVTGNPMFYQLPHIGGADDLRGYRRERFWGKTAFSNSNELRFITNFRSYIMNGKIGLTVFYDQGRVWQPSETSDTWHTDYGAGLLLAPFNALLANIAY